jgi:hypothetical protein
MHVRPSIRAFILPLMWLLSSSAWSQTSTPAADPAAAKQAVKQVGPDEFEIGGIRFNSRTREIRVPTVVNFKQVPIEYMLVHETGKTHESVLRTTINPADLQVAILLCHYEPGTEGLAHPDAPKDLTPIKPLALKTPGANRMTITLEWKAGAEIKHAPLSDWMLDINTRKPPADLDTWVFSGSHVDKDGFAAQAEGSIIATYLDRNAMINSPARGNWDDTAWISNPANIPDEGTPVTVIISPAAPAKDKPADSKSKP